MEIKNFIKFMNIAEKLKCTKRHSWTSSGRHESVAEHSWRLCLMAYLLKNELKEFDMNKVLYMCLIHDLGEAIIGDIPSFDKTDNDEVNEKSAIYEIVEILDDNLSDELKLIIDEMLELKTNEAKIFKALDKLEVVMQHNEAPIETWIDLEYELNLTYGEEEAKEFPYLDELRKTLKRISEEKIEVNF